MIQIDDASLKEFAKTVSEATLRLPRASHGRQNDRGAQLLPAGVLIIPLAVDPGVPVAVFAQDLAELKRGMQSWHRVQTLRDGEIGNRWNVKPGTNTEATALIMQLLSGHLVPGVLGKVLSGGDPLRMLATLLADEQAKGRDPF